MTALDQKVAAAVRHFWRTRHEQARRQGRKTGKKDAGARGAVTGGAQMDGFVSLVRDLLVENGLPAPAIYCERSLELPGFFRPQKEWDLVVVLEGRLLATIEFKSQIGPSFGNNYNNRTEEALGNATDILAAYREGAFQPSTKPWLGYLFLLEQARGSTTPVGVKEPHFPVFPEFKGASYAKRYEILLTKLVRERLYDRTCLLLSPADQGMRGVFNEPAPELTFQNFAASLLGHAIAFTKTRGRR